MGDIIDLTNKYNNINEKQNELDIKHKSQKEHRTKQIIGRCSLGILLAAGIITSIPLYGPKITNFLNETDLENESLDKTTVLDDAELKLLETIYGKDNNFINESIVNYTVINAVDNVKSISVATTDNKEIFKYIHSGLFIKKQNNADEINSLLDKMIDIHFDENPSQKKLQQLNSIIETVDDMNLKFDSISKTIIDDGEKEDER